MHAVLASFGTDGDVFPYLGLGRHLIERGHAVTLASSTHYRDAAVKYGFEFAAIMSSDDVDQLLWNPDFWHPLKAGPLAAKWGIRFLPRQYAVLETLARIPDTVLIANPGLLAARVLHDRCAVPFVSVVLQPWLLPSVYRPPVIPGLTLPRGAPRWMAGLQIELLHRFSDHLLGRDLNVFRATLGLPPVRKALQWWFSPQCILGFFPEWYGPPQPDWPKQVRFLSFPDFDGSAEPLAPDIKRFLESGDPPVAITFGTGIRHAGQLYADAVQACREVGRRAIVLTKYPEQIPPERGTEMLGCSYAPFSRLFPECAAVIHHGGIGTTAKALHANVPQLIIPVCYDQLDNGTRVQSLGRGLFLKLKSATPRRIAKALPPLLEKKHEPIGNSPCAYTAAADFLEKKFFSPAAAGRAV